MKAGHEKDWRRSASWKGAANYAGAALIAAGGYVHYCLYRRGYRFIPKVGVSLLFQVATSAIVATALVVLRPTAGRQSLLVRLAAVGLSLGTLGAFWLTRTRWGLLGFQERGLNPAPQALLALLTESVAAAVFIVLVAVEHQRHRRASVLVWDLVASEPAR
jgi:branched-subunit amino acid ABC-type transport system permease component